MHRRFLARVWTWRRNYVGLAFQEPEHSAGGQTIERSVQSFQQTFVGKPSSGISSTGQDVSSAQDTEPVFQVVSSGVGAALLIKLPPDTEITAATGSAIGSSSRVTSKLTLDSSAVKAVGRKLVGEPIFYQKYYTKQMPGDVLLAPQRMGQVAVVHVRGSTKYALVRDAFLAKTDKVTMKLGLNGVQGSKDVGLANKLVHTVSGPGTVAISHYGGLYRLSLGAGEEYLVNPRNLVMWDLRTQPTKLHPANPVIPSPKSRLRKYRFICEVADSPSLQPKLQYIYSVAKTLRNYILGAPDFVRLQGPGDVYIASRVEPRFARSRIMNALAAANDSLSQAFEQSALFPAAPVEPTVGSYRQTKQQQHPGYAVHKSVDGRPSYYAEVGPKGKVTFVANKPAGPA